ncbi:hypothetical protein MUP77_02615 [Candidatus Bathyarchaeota archaeon]|nr:hypothetical protein [Candidatus Bathyarchaeota archaeon]
MCGFHRKSSAHTEQQRPALPNPLSGGCSGVLDDESAAQKAKTGRIHPEKQCLRANASAQLVLFVAADYD